MTIVRIIVASAVSLAALVAIPASAVQHYYCKYCGHKTTSVNSLTASLCQRHPNGPGKSDAVRLLTDVVLCPQYLQ